MTAEARRLSWLRLPYRVSQGIDILIIGTVTHMLSHGWLKRIMALNLVQLPVVELLIATVDRACPFSILFFHTNKIITHHVNGIKSDSCEVVMIVMFSKKKK